MARAGNVPPAEHGGFFYQLWPGSDTERRQGGCHQFTHGPSALFLIGI